MGAAATSGARPGAKRSVSRAPTVGVVAPRRDLPGLIGALEAEGLAAVGVGPRGKQEVDVLLLAVESPTTNGDDIRRARERHKPSRLVLVAKAATPAEARHLLVEGVAAVVLDQHATEALGPAVRATLAGQVSYPAELMPSQLRSALSKREKQILGMVVLGFTNAEIAAKLYVSESTVKSHLSSAFATLGVRTRKQAVALILDPDAGFGTGILAITDST